MSVRHNFDQLTLPASLSVCPLASAINAINKLQVCFGLEFCMGVGAEKVPQESCWTRDRRLPFVPRDCRGQDWESRRIATMSLQVAAIVLLTVPLSTSWRFVTFHDEHDTGTDGDYRYRYPYRKDSNMLCGSRMRAEQTAEGAGLERN